MGDDCQDGHRHFDTDFGGDGGALDKVEKVVEVVADNVGCGGVDRWFHLEDDVGNDRKVKEAAEDVNAVVVAVVVAEAAIGMVVEHVSKEKWREKIQELSWLPHHRKRYKCRHLNGWDIEM